MQGDDWVALRAGSDHVEIHAIARTDMPSGDVSRADTGAMDSVGGHAAGADKPGVGSSGADIPGVQALLRALETARPARIVWIGGIPPWWPHDVPAEQGREIEAGADVAPGWNVTLVRRASAVAGSWRGAIKWAAIAATVWIGGLQLQAWRLERGAAELRAHAWPCATGVPALARVTDPLRQVRQQLQGGPGQSEFAFLLGAATQHLAFATGEVAGLRYADGALDVEMAPGARRDPAPEGARQTGSRRRPRTAYPSSPKPAAGACAARRRRARHPRAAHELRVPAPGGGAVRGRAQAHRGLARARRELLARTGAARAPHAGRLRLAGAGRAVLAVADRAGAGQGRARARRTDACAA